MKLYLNNLDSLKQFSIQFSSYLQAGDCILLTGEMGAGKTTFVRNVLSSFGYDSVTSPTFTLVNSYDTIPKVFHMDLYRLSSEVDLLSVDIDRYLSDSSAVVFIEWAEKLGDLCPLDFISLHFEYGEGDRRAVTFSYKGVSYRRFFDINVV